jgi:hypothetical protein
MYLHMPSSSPPTLNPCTPTSVLALPSHTSPTSYTTKQDDPSITMMPKHSPKPLTSSLKTTSSNLGTRIGDSLRARAWVSHQHPLGPLSSMLSMKTGCYPAGIHRSCSTVTLLTISLESGRVMHALNVTTLSGLHSKRICNNGMD